MSIVKCFVCHTFGHYAPQCLEWKKGKSKTQQAATSVEAQVKEFVERFEKDFSLISCISGTIFSNSWFMDSGASRYMTRTHELFTSLSRTNLDLHVELGTHAKCDVKEVEIIKFQLELGGSLEVTDVLYVPELKMKRPQY